MTSVGPGSSSQRSCSSDIGSSSTSRIDSSASGLTPIAVEGVAGDVDDRRLVDVDPGLVGDLDAHPPSYGLLERRTRGSSRRPVRRTRRRRAGVERSGSRRRTRGGLRWAGARRGREGVPLGRGVPPAVGVDDVGDQPVPHDVGAGQLAEVEVVDAVEDLAHHLQAGHLAARQVDLRDVAGDDDLRAEPEPRQEHLHLFRRGVLGLVENDERIVKRAAPHVCQRGDFDRSRGHQLRNRLLVEHVVQRVVERAQVGVDLLGERAGQEAEPLARLDRGPREDDPGDLLGLQRLHGLGHGQVGLAGAGRADAEDDGVDVDRVDVALLVQRLGPDGAPAPGQDVQAEHLGRRLAPVRVSAVRQHRHVRRTASGSICWPRLASTTSSANTRSANATSAGSPESVSSLPRTWTSASSRPSASRRFSSR